MTSRSSNFPPDSRFSPRRPATGEDDSLTREFHFTRDDFDYLRKLVTAHTGIVLAENKYDMLYARLMKRLRRLGFSSFAQYVDLIRSGHEEEFIQLVNAVTTNLTAFFRESHHFDYLREQVLPLLNDSNNLYIWSAGCATGEEPYSIAMTLLESLPQSQWTKPRILATDLDSHALQRAMNGVYPLESIKPIPHTQCKRWFLRGKGRNSGMVMIKRPVKELIQFKRLNLLEEWPIHVKLDVVFCRNVLIYFDKTTKQQIIERFARHLRPGGHLFLGHSESLLGINKRFELAGKSYYRLIEPA